MRSGKYVDPLKVMQGQPANLADVHRAPYLSECHGYRRSGGRLVKATYYPPNTRVVVLLLGDPYTSQRGHVVSTRNVAGDMEHRVRFQDGATAVYYADELLGAEGTPSREQG